MKCIPYLLFDGNCREAFKAYEKIFNGKIQAMMTFDETPAAKDMGPEWRNMIIHAYMTFGDSTLMASDAPPQHFEPMQGLSVSLHPETVQEAERIFNALAEGADVKMPLQETFWAQRYGMLVDRFGTPWMINCSKQT
jgi:PhnB protein